MPKHWKLHNYCLSYMQIQGSQLSSFYHVFPYSYAAHITCIHSDVAVASDLINIQCM